MKMKTKVLLAVVALSYAPLGVAGNKAVYPNEKVAEFVIEKLDVTSLPSTFRPKKEKGKKTFADDGLIFVHRLRRESVIRECLLSFFLLRSERGRQRSDIQLFNHKLRDFFVGVLRFIFRHPERRV